MKSKSYKYSCNIASEWIHNRIPEGGGHYSSNGMLGCRLEADSECLYMGFKSHLLAVKNSELGLLIIASPDGCSFSGGVSQIIHNLSECREGFLVKSLIPADKRGSNRWNTHSRDKCDPSELTPVFVDHLTKNMAYADIEELTPHILHRYARTIPIAAKGGRSAMWVVSGVWRREVGVVQYLHHLFDRIGIPFPEEWDNAIIQASAKRRLINK